MRLGRPKVLIVIQVTGPRGYDHVGQFVKDFDPKGAEGRGTLTLTPELDRAKKFRSSQEAEDFYLQEARDGNPALRFFSVRTLAVTKVD